MSNVEYKCPVEDCRNRHFDNPGGTRAKCPQHDKFYEQAEFYEGAVYGYQDEDGKMHTNVSGDPHPEGKVEERRNDQATVPEEVQRDDLRARYQEATGNKADGRLGISTLRTEVEEVEKEQKRLREEYSSTTGEDPDMKWTISDLQDRIEEANDDGSGDEDDS